MTNKGVALLHAAIYTGAYLGVLGLGILIVEFVPYGFQIVMGTIMAALVGSVAWFFYSEKLSDLNLKDS